MKAAVISFTKAGYELGRKIRDWLQEQGYEAEAAVKCRDLEESIPESLDQWTRERFAEVDALVYIGAAGIAVRAIAPYVQAKTLDPAVLVIDEQGAYCIPLLSGHLGGANELALALAAAFGMEPVVTTATDRNGKWAVDVFAKKNGLLIRDMEKAKRISADLLAGKEIWIKMEDGKEAQEEPDVYIGLLEHPGWRRALYLIPRAGVLGIGCRKGVSLEQIEEAVAETLEAFHVCPECIGAVATIDRKAEEPGLLEYCRKRGISLLSFSAEELSEVEGEFSSSEFVRQVTGIDNVCERSAVKASKGGKLLIPKQKKDQVTAALAVTEWSVEFEESICGGHGSGKPGTDDGKSPGGIRIL